MEGENAKLVSKVALSVAYFDCKDNGRPVDKYRPTYFDTAPETICYEVWIADDDEPTGYKLYREYPFDRLSDAVKEVEAINSDYEYYTDILG